jgi:hypothetical protein
MTSQPEDREFLAKLREEMGQCVQRRFQFQLAKVTSLGTLIGAGVLLVKDIQLTVFFYVIPYIAMTFDLFIVSESFRLRRLSSFVHNEKKKFGDAEFRWEAFVRANPGRLASIANYLFTVITATGCTIILVMMQGPNLWFKNAFNIVWLAVLVGTLVFHRWLNLWPSGRSWEFYSSLKDEEIVERVRTEKHA